VFLNERDTSYIQDLQLALESLVRVTQARPRIAGADTRGKVFVLRTDLISAETRALLMSVARVVLWGRRGSLADQMERMQPTPVTAPRQARRVPHAIPSAGEREPASRGTGAST
jgi:cyclic beta-1,2-glucan synthetase